MLTLLMLLQIGAAPTTPVFGQSPAHCPSETTAATDRGQNGPLHRSREPQEVRRYLLLDRRDANDCPLPISFAVPGASRGVEMNLNGAPRSPGIRAPDDRPAPTPTTPDRRED